MDSCSLHCESHSSLSDIELNSVHGGWLADAIAILSLAAVIGPTCIVAGWVHGSTMAERDNARDAKAK